MKKTVSILCAAAISFSGAAGLVKTERAEAANPYLPLWEHIPDGEPHVFEDPDNPGKYRIYIYGSHDINKVYYCGDDQVVWSAPVENPTDWRYEGVSFHYDNNGDGEYDLLFAPDVCEVKNDDGSKTYYLYPNDMSGVNVVAKSDRPAGPFEVCSTDSQIGGDPAVFVDDDGKAYAYYGFCESFCSRLDPATGHLWNVHEHPLGGWSAEETDEDGGAIRTYPTGNTHGSVENINGQWYVFYHRQTGTNEFCRQSMAEPVNIYLDDNGRLDSPYESKGKKIAEFTISASDMPIGNVYTSELVGMDGVSGRHAVYFNFETDDEAAGETAAAKSICKFYSFVFTDGTEQKLSGEDAYYGEVKASGTVSANMSAETDVPENALDGDLWSRWGSGAPQTGGEEFIYDLGAEYLFNTVSLYSRDNYARGYRVYVSNDGESYTEVASGKGTDETIPYQIIKFDKQRARYIKIEQTDSVSEYIWWSIYDIKVLSRQGCMSGYKVAVSDDGENYSVVAEGTGETDDDGSKFGSAGVRYGEVWAVKLNSDPVTHDVTHEEPFQLISHGNYEEVPTGLKGEGYHSYKIGDYYYIMMIQGEGGQSEEIIWRKKTLDMEPVEGLVPSEDTVVRDGWECKKIFIGDIADENGNKALRSDSGIAQGCIVDTAAGDWYSTLFQTTGAVGRIQVLMPVKWEDGWPVLGNNGESINEYYEKPVQGMERKSIVVSDDFTNGEKRRYFSDTETEGVTAGIAAEDLPGKTAAEIAQNEYGYNGSNLKLEWQWNHNPNNNLWSLTDRDGYLRLKSGIITDTIRQARNTLTQRVYGPNSSAYTVLETDGLKEGDVAGITAYQNQYGYVGITVRDGKKYIVMNRARQKDDKYGSDMELIPFEDSRIYLGVNCELEDRVDQATFCYSTDGKNWTQIGDTLLMTYDWPGPDFVGYRFGLFCYPTKEIGGYADFDSFNVSDELIAAESNRTLRGSFCAMDETNPLLGKALMAGNVPEDIDTDIIYTTGRDGSENGAVQIDKEHGVKLDIDPLKSPYGYTVSYWVKMTSDKHDWNAPQLFIANPDNLWSWIAVQSDAMWLLNDKWGEREMKLNEWQMITLTVSKKRVASVYADGELVASKKITAGEGVSTKAYICFGVNKWQEDKEIYFDLDDVYLYTDELDAEQVKALYDGDTPGTVSGLLRERISEEFTITIENGEYSVNIPEAYKSGSLYVARYGADGALKAISTAAVGESRDGNLRAFLWDADMTPLCGEAIRLVK